MAPAPRFERYRWAGGEEWMLRLGPDAGPTVVAALPLFEEANRMRATLVAALGDLAGRGIGAALPDLPGQGDSLVATRDARLGDWRAAFAAAAAAAGIDGVVHAVTIRGGALIDGEAVVAGRWRLSPLDGATQRRELERQRALAEERTDLYAGNALSDALLTELEAAAPTGAAPTRIVRLAGDPRPADATLPFAPPWRAAEPRRDPALAAALADDIAAWIARCGGR